MYTQQGIPEKYDPDSVQFVSDRQFAFAAGVSGMIMREKAAATFLLGMFYAESLIFAETSNAVGAIQVAGSTQTSQTPFFIAACDYVLIGDEFYAASAYLTREPVLVGSLVGQDWAKLMMASMILLGFLSNSIDRSSVATRHRDDDDENGVSTWVSVEKPDPTKPNYLNGKVDTKMHQFFNPMITKEMKEVVRPKDPDFIKEEVKK